MDPAHDDELPETMTVPVRRGVPVGEVPPAPAAEAKDEPPPSPASEAPSKALIPGSLLQAALAQAAANQARLAEAGRKDASEDLPADPPEAMTMAFRRGNGSPSERRLSRPPPGDVERPAVPVNPPPVTPVAEDPPEARTMSFRRGGAHGFDLEPPPLAGSTAELGTPTGLVPEDPPEARTMSFRRGGRTALIPNRRRSPAAPASLGTPTGLVPEDPPEARTMSFRRGGAPRL